MTVTLDPLSQLILSASASAALGVAAFVLSMTMRRQRKHARSFVDHILRVVLLIAMVYALRATVASGLVWLQLPPLNPEVYITGTGIAASLIIGRELFALINRLTHDQINKGSDPTTARAIARILKLGIVLAVLLMFGEHFGVGFSGLLAFGGIGGIAIGLASKDMLGNVFSGIMLFFDRPFNIGDWVSSPDRKIEGTVQEIGWRMTRILTFDHRPLYVPNSLFSSISVENPGRMTNRRIETSIGLRYEDAAVLAPVVRDIRAMLHAHPAIAQDQIILVNFNEFADSSLNIMVYCFTRTTDWAEWLNVQQDVYLQLIRIVHGHGADFAFPSQTLYPAPDVASAPASGATQGLSQDAVHAMLAAAAAKTAAAKAGGDKAGGDKAGGDKTRPATSAPEPAAAQHPQSAYAP